jgi:ATP-binding protein involved in chromosome partitioning
MSIDSKELENIYSRLDTVKDPEIGVSIVKLKMIDSIEKDSDFLNIKIKLTVPGCPLSATIEKDIKAALGGAGYENVNVAFGYMTRKELEDVKSTLSENRRDLPPPIAKYTKKNIKNIIAVYSAKGGVGKSSVVVLLALTASRLGYKTGILDCDVSGPSVRTLFNSDWHASINNENKLNPLVDSNIKIISIDMLTNAEALVWRGPLVSSAIKQMYSDTDWGELDVLFLDLPPGTSDGPITVFQTIPVDRILLVTTPQNLSQVIGKKTLIMAEALKVPIVGIIENMSYLVCDHCGEKIYLPDSKTRILNGIPILGRLPFNKAVSTDIKSLDFDSLHSLESVIKYSLIESDGGVDLRRP